MEAADIMIFLLSMITFVFFYGNILFTIHITSLRKGDWEAETCDKNQFSVYIFRCDSISKSWLLEQASEVGKPSKKAYFKTSYIMSKILLGSTISRQKKHSWTIFLFYKSPQPSAKTPNGLPVTAPWYCTLHCHILEYFKLFQSHLQ